MAESYKQRSLGPAGGMTGEVWGFLEPEKLGEMATEITRLSRQTGGTACGIIVGGVESRQVEELGHYGLAKLYVLESPAQDILSYRLLDLAVNGGLNLLAIKRVAHPGGKLCL